MTCILGTQMELVNKQGTHVLEQKTCNTIYCLTGC